MHFIGFYPYPYYAYASPDTRNQPYVDPWGRYIYVQQCVPAQYLCS